MRSPRSPLRRVVACLVACLAPALCAAVALGQDATGGEADPTWQPPPPTEEVKKLQKDFSNLYTSLRNSLGLQESQLGTVRDFRQRVEQRLQDEPQNPYLLAMDLQLSMWLKDDDRVDEDFRSLLTVTGDAGTYGQPWISYFRGRGDVDRLTGIYRTLLEMDPDDRSLRLSWADQLRQEGRFQEALETLQGTEWDVEEDPTPTITLAEVQMGLHRFSEAVATLESIPETAFESKGSLKPRVDLIKRQAEQYVEYWAEEQELRSTESAADDLPRVAIDTSRGRLVVELFENQAPNTVANFVKLAGEGYYDGTVFHRRIPGTLIMGGDKPNEEGNTTGASNPGYRIPDEHTREDARRHFSATLAMHKSGQRDSGGSLFYLTTKPLPERNGRYTVFGRVIEGEDVLSALRKDDTIESMTVLRKREHEYEPQTLPLDGAPTATPVAEGGLTAAPPEATSGEGGEAEGAGGQGTGEGGGEGGEAEGAGGEGTGEGGGEGGSA